MLIKATKNWKDLADSGTHHKGALSRREFVQRGMATGALAVSLGNFVLEKAGAVLPATCPAPQRNPGGLVQIFSEGGYTAGARPISSGQAAAVSAAMAANYGITGQANLVTVGPNFVVDSTGAWGATLLLGPPGYPGGSAAWRTEVLAKCSAGGHLGPFNQDDGAGQNTGLVGGFGTGKASTIGKDIQLRVSKTLARYAIGKPAATAPLTNPAALSTVFSMTPPVGTGATALTDAVAMDAASTAAGELSAGIPEFKVKERKGAANLQNTANCAFFGNSALADPNYGASLFNPALLAPLAAKTTVAGWSAADQAVLSSAYQSASGLVGGIVIELNGYDYHGTDPQGNIAPKEIDECRKVVAALVAAAAANAKTTILLVSNGQAIASGVRQTNNPLVNGGANVAVNTPVAEGDAGGSYNGIIAIFYDPAGAPTTSRWTGTVSSVNGNAKTDASVASSGSAFAGAVASAIIHASANGTLPKVASDMFAAAGTPISAANVIR